MTASVPASRLGETLVLEALSQAADAGAPCPTNEDLAEMLELAMGWTALSTASGIVSRLERLGAIRVERYQRERRVTIMATGKQTAEVRNPAPHWRTRPRDVPSPPPKIVSERRPDTAQEIFAAAARLGRSPADFLADLVWIGWQAMKDETIQPGTSSGIA